MHFGDNTLKDNNYIGNTIEYQLIIELLYLLIYLILDSQFEVFLTL